MERREENEQRASVVIIIYLLPLYIAHKRDNNINLK